MLHNWTRGIWKMLGPFATASRRTPPVLVLHCHSPGVVTVARRPPAHRCPQQQQQRQGVTEETAMAHRMGPIIAYSDINQYALWGPITTTNSKLRIRMVHIFSSRHRLLLHIVKLWIYRHSFVYRIWLKVADHPITPPQIQTSYILLILTLLAGAQPRVLVC